MMTVYLLEDDRIVAETIRSLLKDYAKEAGADFKVKLYGTAESLLEGYGAGADILFADIQLPGTDGMSAMRRVRERDPDVSIIFVTALAQLAAEGYSVGALAYLIKPVNRAALFSAVDSAVRLAKRRRHVRICIASPDGDVFADSSEIAFVEIFGHQLVYHTVQGEIREWAPLSKAENALAGCNFSRCHKSFLVNLRFVEDVRGDEVCAAGTWLKIGNTKRTAFLESLHEYLKK